MKSIIFNPNSESSFIAIVNSFWGFSRDRKFMVMSGVLSIGLLFLGVSFYPFTGTNPGTSFYLNLSGFGDTNVTIPYDLDLHIVSHSEKGGGIPISLEKSVLVLSNDSYLAEWEGNIDGNNHVITLWGRAQDDDGHVVHTVLIVRLLNTTQDWSFVKIAGVFIKENQWLHFSNITKMINSPIIENEDKESVSVSINENPQPNATSDSIILLTRQYDTVYQQYPYAFTVKVYNLKDNPSSNFDQHGGEIRGARIISFILDSNGNIVRSFNGITDQFGYFSDGFQIPDIFPQGTYTNFVVAEKDGNSVSKTFFFNVFSLDRSSHTSGGGQGGGGGGGQGGGGGGGQGGGGGGGQGGGGGGGQGGGGGGGQGGGGGGGQGGGGGGGHHHG